MEDGAGSSAKVAPAPATAAATDGGGQSSKQKEEDVDSKKASATPRPSDAALRWASANNLVHKVNIVSKEEEARAIDLFVEGADDHHHHGKRDKFVLHPNSPFRRVWDVVTIILVLYLCWKIPFTVGFGHWYGNKALKPFELAMDVWFGIDIILNFNTGHVHSGHIVMNRKAIAKHYFEMWFWIDMSASIPFDLLITNVDKHSRKAVKMIKWFKIPRLLRVGRILKQLKGYARFYKAFLGLALYVWMTHFIGCVWVGIADPCDLDPYPKVKGFCADTWGMYAYSLHVGIAALVGGSVNQWPGDEWVQDRIITSGALHAFTAGASILGITLTAWVFGEMSVILHHMDPKGWDFFSRLDSIKQEMSTYNLSEKLQSEIKAHYDYCYMNNRHGMLSLVGDPLMSESLKKKVMVHMHKEVILNVEFFRTASADCISMACETLVHEIHMPGIIVIEAGQLTRNLSSIKMYIVHRGKVEVYAERNGEAKRIAVLDSNKCFGEMAMLNPERKRDCVVKTLTVCELYSLSYPNFLRLLDVFPAFKRSLAALARSRGMPMSESAEVFTKTIEKSPAEISERIARLEHMLHAQHHGIQTLLRATK